MATRNITGPIVGASGNNAEGMIRFRLHYPIVSDGDFIAPFSIEQDLVSGDFLIPVHVPGTYEVVYFDSLGFKVWAFDVDISDENLTDLSFGELFQLRL